jgi:hypothetical protein
MQRGRRQKAQAGSARELSVSVTSISSHRVSVPFDSGPPVLGHSDTTCVNGPRAGSSIGFDHLTPQSLSLSVMFVESIGWGAPLVRVP